MLEVIGHATQLAEQIAQRPLSFFDFWRELDRQQRDWAESRGLAPLLANLGVSLVERAALDGLCRLAGQPLHRMVDADRLGLRLGEVYPELGTAQPRDVLPAAPLGECFVRHTVGLGDALAPGDLTAEDRVDDGLPQDLEASIRAYGLRYFKVKLSGAAERDFPRLRALASLLERETGGEFLRHARRERELPRLRRVPRILAAGGLANGPARALAPDRRRRATRASRPRASR